MRRSILAGLIAASIGSTLLWADGINIPFSFPASTCTNQFIRSIAASTGVGTCATVGTNDIAASVTLTTPNLGTPSAINLTNATALPTAALPTGIGFRAHRNAVDQTGIADSTFTTVQANVTAFNNGSYYNTGTYTWTPPAGAVELCVKVVLQNGIFAVGALGIVQITKNGTSIGNNIANEPIANNSFYLSFCIHDSANGTDAYLAQVYGDTTSGTFDVGGAIAQTWFSGAVVH